MTSLSNTSSNVLSLSNSSSSAKTPQPSAQNSSAGILKAKNNVDKCLTLTILLVSALAIAVFGTVTLVAIAGTITAAASGIGAGGIVPGIGMAIFAGCLTAVGIGLFCYSFQKL